SPTARLPPTSKTTHRTPALHTSSSSAQSHHSKRRQPPAPKNAAQRARFASFASTTAKTPLHRSLDSRARTPADPQRCAPCHRSRASTPPENLEKSVPALVKNSARYRCAAQLFHRRPAQET